MQAIRLIELSLISWPFWTAGGWGVRGEFWTFGDISVVIPVLVLWNIRIKWFAVPATSASQKDIQILADRKSVMGISCSSRVRCVAAATNRWCRVLSGRPPIRIYLSAAGLCCSATARYRDLLNADITMRRIVILHRSIDTNDSTSALLLGRAWSRCRRPRSRSLGDFLCFMLAGVTRLEPPLRWLSCRIRNFSGNCWVSVWLNKWSVK